MSFQELSLIDPILQALAAEGYTVPTPIQEQSIPVALSGKDLLGTAQTGTGKTAAFAIPILQMLHATQGPRNSWRSIKALVLTPTRELAIQIGESFAAYGKHTNLKHTIIYGGVSQHTQTDALKKGVDILISTPGRLLDLINQRFINLQHVEYFVLDEADRMLDMGFIHDINKIIARLPLQRQTLFFSATMPPQIQQLAATILRNPVHVQVTPVSSTAEKVTQAVYQVERTNKKHLLIHVLKEKGNPATLVFTRTKHGADRVVKELNKAGIAAEAIHGNKSQNARQRALSNFKSKQIRVLVATDIAARGIDIEELPLVINYELPNEPETYVHRIGRTGRAGASGVALSFCDAEEKDSLKQIHKLIGKTLPVSKDHPYMAEDKVLPQIAHKEQQGRFNRMPSRNTRVRSGNK
jgi:ATP-dependent RNA helicase RhlE